jgi:uncharacterized protein (TIGR02246 family)
MRSHEDVAAIRQTVADAGKHQNDPDPFAALHTADAIIVNIAGRRVLGRDAIHEAMTKALATPLAQVRTTVEIEDISAATPDVAIVSCVKYVSDERAKPGPSLPTKGRLIYVLVREPDAWRIASAQTTPIA